MTGYKRRYSKISREADIESSEITAYHDQLPPPMRSRAFRLPRWNSRSVQTITKALFCKSARFYPTGSYLPGHQSSRNEMAETKSRTLYRGTDYHDSRAEEDGPPSPQNISYPYSCDCPTETSNVVGRY